MLDLISALPNPNPKLMGIAVVALCVSQFALCIALVCHLWGTHHRP